LGKVFTGKVLGFLGAGNMAEALIKGILQAGLFPPQDILAADLRAARTGELSARYGIGTARQNTEVAQRSDILIIAVKPQVIPGVLREIAAVADATKLLISIAAGVPLSALETGLNPGGDRRLRIIRVMPNTPALVQEGAAALAGSAHASEQDLQAALNIFNAVGKTFILNESLMDAVTGLSGSGPAYICSMLEALSDAGVKMGLPRDVSAQLSLQTIIGTARLIEQTGDSPAVIRERVASPGGTTIYGLHALERGQFKNTIINAVEAATERSTELGQASGPVRDKKR